MRTLSYVFVFLLAFAGTATGQKPPMKWGDIPEEHLLMTSFPADTNAAAVVLGDYGETYFTPNYDRVYEIHRRVKLLRESAYEDYGTISFSYPIGRNGARLRGLKAQTVTVDANGKAVEQEVDRKSFFKEKVGDDFERVSFTFPALAPGAIVEYTYKLELPGGIFLPSWTFQEGEPVLMSEYRIEFPGQLQYVVSTVGDTFSKMTVNETDTANRPGGTFVKSRWVMENVPALREEPYMTTASDYRHAVRFQLAGVNIPGWGNEGFIKTWPKLAEDLLGADGNYGQYLKSPGREVKEAALAAAAGADTQIEKIRGIYDYVRANVECDCTSNWYVSTAPKDVLKNKSGDSPSINLLLVAMLREAGFTADPVMISTRSHGRPRTSYPLLQQFDDLIVHVAAGGTSYFLDASDTYRPFDLLPHEALNGEVWVVRDPSPAWMPISTDQKHHQQRMITMELAEDGSATGTLTAANGGYAALATRRSLSDDKLDSHEGYVRKHVFDDLSGLTLTNVVVTNPDDHRERVQFTMDFTLDAAANAAGDFLYLSPFLIDRIGENPLKAPTREFPVDMGYGSEYHYVANITLPEGYEVAEAPPNQRFAISGGGALYHRVVGVEGRTLQVMTRFIIAKSTFEPKQYADLRAFYDRVIAAEADQVVIRKAAPAVTGAITEGEEGEKGEGQ